MQINTRNIFIGSPFRAGKYYAYDWEQLKKTFISIVNKDMDVVDIGSSNFQKALDLAKYCKRFTGIEIDKKKMFRPVGNMEIINAGWQDLSSLFKENSIDIVVSSHVIEHVSDDLEVINETYKVLKKGGILLFLTPNRTRLVRHVAKFFFMESKFIYKEHIREYAYEDLLTLIFKSKFSNFSIKKTVLGLHSGRFMFYFKKSPKIFEKFVNFFEVRLIK